MNVITQKTLSGATATVATLQNSEFLRDMKSSVRNLALGLDNDNLELAKSAIKNIETQCQFISENIGAVQNE